MTKGDRVRIIGGKYKGQTATLERRRPGGGKEWTVTLDGSYNTGIVKDDEIVAVGTKAHDSLSFTTLFWAGIIAALIAKHYGGPKETVGMGSYDLRNYQPERKTW